MQINCKKNQQNTALAKIKPNKNIPNKYTKLILFECRLW
jgi:hypothetical protein